MSRYARLAVSTAAIGTGASAALAGAGHAAAATIAALLSAAAALTALREIVNRENRP